MSGLTAIQGFDFARQSTHLSDRPPNSFQHRRSGNSAYCLEHRRQQDRYSPGSGREPTSSSYSTRPALAIRPNVPCGTPSLPFWGVTLSATAPLPSSTLTDLLPETRRLALAGTLVLGPPVFLAGAVWECSGRPPGVLARLGLARRRSSAVCFVLSIMLSVQAMRPGVC